MIYQLGDEDAKQHIDSMGILQAKPTMTASNIERSFFLL